MHAADRGNSIGQIASPIEWIKDPHPPADDPQREFAAQRTKDATLVLTASNGFFDQGILAAGTSEPADAAGPAFITRDFGWIESWNNPGSCLRWHVWVEKPGKLDATLEFTPGGKGEGALVSASIGDATQKLTLHSNSNRETLKFEVRQAGWQKFELKLVSVKSGGPEKLHRITLTGTAAEHAAVLRSRWRPAACHARFSSSGVANPVAWVMTTKASPAAMVGSYSPVTTPFGYYGCSIGPDGNFSGSANFSMWSFGKGKPTPQERWSHLLAVGSPDAEFGSFGHEGSGVKVRGDWKPFGEHCKEVTLALRAEPAGERTRWYGYFLDPQTHRFRLYAVGATSGRRKIVLNPGAFVEQPGPPDRQRSGDLVRDVLRRGWMLDQAGKWHWIDTMRGGSDKPANKHWSSSKDGWFSMGMGGMAQRRTEGESVRIETSGLTLPSWLNASAADDLRKLPVRIGPRKFHKQSADSWSVSFDLSGMERTGDPAATVTAFYGPADCLTFDHDLGYRESKTHAWNSHTDPQPARMGANTILLKRVASDSPQFLRLLVENRDGRIWTFETDNIIETP